MKKKIKEGSERLGEIWWYVLLGLLMVFAAWDIKQVKENQNLNLLLSQSQAQNNKLQDALDYNGMMLRYEHRKLLVAEHEAVTLKASLREQSHVVNQQDDTIVQLRDSVAEEQRKRDWAAKRYAADLEKLRELSKNCR